MVPAVVLAEVPAEVPAVVLAEVPAALDRNLQRTGRPIEVLRLGPRLVEALQVVRVAGVKWHLRVLERHLTRARSDPTRALPRDETPYRA